MLRSSYHYNILVFLSGCRPLLFQVANLERLGCGEPGSATGRLGQITAGNVAVGRAPFNGLESAVHLLAGERQYETLAVGQARRVGLGGTELLAGGVSHPVFFYQRSESVVQCQADIPP